MWATIDVLDRHDAPTWDCTLVLAPLLLAPRPGPVPVVLALETSPAPREQRRWNLLSSERDLECQADCVGAPIVGTSVVLVFAAATDHLAQRSVAAVVL